MAYKMMNDAEFIILYSFFMSCDARMNDKKNNKAGGREQTEIRIYHTKCN